MKKIIVLILVLVTCTAVLTACGETQQEPVPAVTELEPSPSETPAPTPTPTPVPVFSILGAEYDYYSESVDLAEITPEEVPEVAETLSQLPFVSTVNLMRNDGTCALTAEEAAPLLPAALEAEFECAFDLYGTVATNKTEELRYERLNLDSDGIDVFRTALPFLKALKMLRLGDSQLDNDAMDALRADFPEKNIIWSVYFVNHFWMTDTTLINSTQINDSNIDNLKYMHDVLYLDFGHDRFLTSLDFVRYFPKLQVIIFSITTISDISPLADCPELEFVEGFSTRISDLSPLAGLTKLEYLNVGDNDNLYDVSPLYGLSTLKKIRICGMNAIPPEQLEQLREELPDCDVSTVGGHSANSGGWRYNDDGSINDRYALLREQMEYDKAWDVRQSNSPSALEG